MRSRNSRASGTNSNGIGRRDALVLDPTLPAPLTSRAVPSYKPTSLPRRPTQPSRILRRSSCMMNRESGTSSSSSAHKRLSEETDSDVSRQQTPLNGGTSSISDFTQPVTSNASIIEVPAGVTYPSPDSDASISAAHIPFDFGNSALTHGASDTGAVPGALVTDKEEAGSELDIRGSRPARVRISVEDLLSHEPTSEADRPQELTFTPFHESQDPSAEAQLDVGEGCSSGPASTSGIIPPGTTSSQKDDTPVAPPEPDLLCTYTCPICFCPPTNATLVPCGHVFCGPCLFMAIKANLKREPHGLARCPVCRTVVLDWNGIGGGVIGLKPRTAVTL
jgi:hypothetical protein